MKDRTTILKALYLIPTIMAIVFSALCETGLLECGWGIEANNSTEEVIALGIMEMLTLCTIPVALRLMKFQTIAKKAKASWSGYVRMASIRILMMALPMLADTLLYYYYMIPAFGYLAIILLLAMVFVYPSKSRCKNETE